MRRTDCWNGTHDTWSNSRGNDPEENKHALIRPAFRQWYQITEDDRAEVEDSAPSHSLDSCHDMRRSRTIEDDRRERTASSDEPIHGLRRTRKRAPNEKYGDSD